uniref:isoleucine--tRNA ligase n=4 Tax=Mesocestoides corti TaxID=53468 RepID=A0A5K3FQW9_MESCO
MCCEAVAWDASFYFCVLKMPLTHDKVWSLLRRQFLSVSGFHYRRVNYKATLNSPVFPFAIELDHKVRLIKDPDHGKISDANFILHDGPPYANGPVHFGHALNKILKDFVLRFHKIHGKTVSLVPGWDCHGLPIELTVIGNNFSLPPADVRIASLQRAMTCMAKQMSSFKDFNVIADWNNAYSTLDHSYQSAVISSFYELYAKGFIVREPKPVYWSRATRSAISESELEYNADHESPSVYFLVELNTQPAWIPTRLRGHPTWVVIWTTTPWTIAANEAVIFSSSEKYAAVLDNHTNRILLIAHYLAQSLAELTSSPASRFELVACATGDHFENYVYKHPLGRCDRPYRLMPGDFIQREKGTGFVHCAPSHGKEDFDFAKHHKLPLRSLVDSETRFTDEAGRDLAGRFVQDDGNSAVIHGLGDRVLALSRIRHNFPYEWRTQQPVIKRLSEQWFVNTEKLESLAMEAYAGVDVFPPDRKPMMNQFIENRPFWCISRQRTWGVPIPVLYRKLDNSAIVDADFIGLIADRVGREGSEFWWTESSTQLIPASCLEKWNLTPDDVLRGMDIFDVWFESGLSWKAVLPENRIADVYLEGLDQFRGWFSSSLLLSTALTGRPPFRTIVVHGFTTDSEGRKMSKSLGNVIAPEDMLRKCNGEVDVLRRWAASSGLAARSSAGTKSFAAHTAAYKKLRNMFRFILGNLHDLPAAGLDWLDQPLPQDLSLLEKWCLCLIGRFCDDCFNTFYPNYRYESIIAEGDQLVSRLSTVYFNAIKDSLYCDPPASERRRMIQKTLLYATEALSVCFAPILPNLVEEVASSLHRTASLSHLERMASPHRGADCSTGSAIVRTAVSWASNHADLLDAVALASTLRQEIASHQYPNAETSRSAWPGPAANPLARLHVTVTTDSDGECLAILKRLNEDVDAEGYSTLCKILRCVSVEITDATARRGEALAVTANVGTQRVSCLLRIADHTAQCPRCRLYNSSNASLCQRCASLVPI